MTVTVIINNENEILAVEENGKLTDDYSILYIEEVKEIVRGKLRILIKNDEWLKEIWDLVDLISKDINIDPDNDVDTKMKNRRNNVQR